MFELSKKHLTDRERHDYILRTFILNRSEKERNQKRDIDVIKEHHQFLWDDDCDPVADSWEMRLARRYYDKLFKEYCIADLTRHKENKVAMRWRTEAEVVSGKGQFQCGSRKCEECEGLRSWEVNFAYQEQGQQKNALVKLRLCPKHSAQLNYRSRKREIKRLKHRMRREIKESKRKHRKRNKTEQKTGAKGDIESSSDSDTVISETGKKETENRGVENDGDAETLPALENAENVWTKRPDVGHEVTSRETEFERYLEDLLL